MYKKHVIGLFSATIMLVGSLGSAHAALALQGRLPVTPGGTDYQAYYDPNLDITWAADADINSNSLIWDDALTWAAGVTIGGIDGWRLPSADANGDGSSDFCFVGSPACADNEMASLYIELGITVSTPGPFSNVLTNQLWWSSTTDFTFSTFARVFNFNFGDQSDGRDKSLTQVAAWAVHDGDVGVVPVPSAVWLFGSGLLGLASLARQRT